MASTSVEITNAFEQVASTSGRSTMTQRKLPYDVFINHRGPDVKHTLAATLYKTLTAMGLRVFLDKEELQFGDFLPTEIEEAMRSASLHIAIFSQTYAQSPWCLAELSFMLKTGTPIVPVFYHVQPDDVRYAKGVYADAFSRHQEKGRQTLEKLEEWKNALKNISYNLGAIIHNEDDEGDLLKNIVHCVLKVIKNVPFVVADHPTGVDDALIDFERTTLQSAETDGPVQIVGIWGMGGSGKTTFAKQLYNNKSKTMEKSSFLLDVRDAASQSVLHNKQKKLLEDLGLKGVSIENIEEGKGILASHLRSVQVLIILDDVDNVDQLNALVPKKDNLGRGSLIVVTTRELEVLRGWGISSIYKMKTLNPTHAKQLFCWHAFLQPSPPQAFGDLVEKFLSVCNGLPLSLKVFGAQLYGISDKDYWESQLHKISRILPSNIKDRLQVSYDALDDEEKQIFLDTACFFIGKKKSSAIAAWDGLGWSGLHSWERLLNKCLVELNYDDNIRMHDHLRDLGREIANNQSPSRLWSSRQIDQIINVDNGGPGMAIRGIMARTDESTIKVEQFARYSQGGIINTRRGSCSPARSLLCGNVNTHRGSCSLARSLPGLKILQLTGNFNYQVIGDLSRELVWLRLFGSGQRNLSSLGSLKNLRVLELLENWYVKKHLKELWKTDSNAPVQLRELVISECSNFQGFPKSIGCLRYLRKVVVSGRSKMRSLPEEFCRLQSLEHLELKYQRLLSLPCSFGDLINLRHLGLAGCRELRSLPVSFKELTLLQYLDLMECSNLAFESDMLENMTKLEIFNIQGCGQLEELPRHITNQASLTELLIPSGIREVPVNIGQLRKLQNLTIYSSELTSLPTSIGDLSSLTSLYILGCLYLLEDLTIRYSGVESLPESVSQLINLQRLDVWQCPLSDLDLRAGLFPCLENISLKQTNVSKISISEDCCAALENLILSYNDHLTEIEVLPNTIKKIELYDCKVLRKIVSGIDGLVNIQELRISGCPELDALPSFAQSAFLREFKLSGCDRVKKVQGLEHCRALEVLRLSGCPELDALPSFAQAAFLRVFELEGCYGVKKIQGLEHCKALEALRAHTRWEECGMESLKGMERLRIVHLRAISKAGVEGCIQSMQKWPKEEIIVCTRAVPGAVSLVKSFAFPNLSILHSFAHKKIKSYASFKLPSPARCILLCLVVNCRSPKTSLYWSKKSRDRSPFVNTRMELEEGKWVWIALFAQHSMLHINMERIVWIEGREGEVEKGVVVMGEEDRVVEAFTRLCALVLN